MIQLRRKNFSNNERYLKRLWILCLVMRMLDVVMVLIICYCISIEMKDSASCYYELC